MIKLILEVRMTVDGCLSLLSLSNRNSIDIWVCLLLSSLFVHECFKDTYYWNKGVKKNDK